MDTREYLTRIKSDAEAALAQLPPPVDTGGITVKAGGNLQAALDAGGVVRLEPGAAFSGSFAVKKPGTRLLGGLGSQLLGPSDGPAFFVPMGMRDVQASGFSAQTAWDQSCILIGQNDPVQNTPDKAPAGMILSDIQVPKHRGKRAFELNCAQLVMLNCGAADVYDPVQHRDSQAICVLNAPGDISVQGGIFSAGSEVVLIGGASGTQAEKIIPARLSFDGLTLMRPLSWRTDGIKRVVKTTFEVKTGIDIELKNATLDGVWKDGQDGYAITITPRSSGAIARVHISDVQIRNSGAGFNILSHDNEAFSGGVSGLLFERVIAVLDKSLSSGRFMQLGGSVQGMTLDACDVKAPESIVLSYESLVWDEQQPAAGPPTSHNSYVSKGVKLTGNRFNAGGYGLMLTGAAGAGAYGVFWKEAWPDGIISGNTFAGPSGLAHKKNLPADNTFTS